MNLLTPRQRDIDDRLHTNAGLSFDDWVAKLRGQGHSWSSLSIQLHHTTGDTVPGNTLRRWADQ